MEDIIERVVEYISNEWGSSDIISAWNDYCDSNNYYDNRIEYVAEIDDLEQGSASEILSHIDLDSFNLNDEYMVYSTYGWQSFGYWDDSDSPIYLSDLASWMVRNEETFNDDELEEIILGEDEDEGYEDEEEEEEI